MLLALFGGLLLLAGSCWLIGYRAYERTNVTIISYFDNYDFYNYSPDAHLPEWIINVPHSWPAKPNVDYYSTSSLFVDSAYQQAEPEQGSTFHFALEQKIGWPLRAMVSEICATGITEVDLGIYRSGIKFSNSKPLRRFPLKILPVGFIANWLLYSAACFAVLLGPVILLRRYRSARRAALGLCQSCGYELTSLKTCPECGTPADPRTMVQ